MTGKSLSELIVELNVVEKLGSANPHINAIVFVNIYHFTCL